MPRSTQAADLAVDVLWDRREAERRAAADGVDDERRKVDRRKKPPFTWDVADFAVAVEPDPQKTDDPSVNPPLAARYLMCAGPMSPPR